MQNPFVKGEYIIIEAKFGPHARPTFNQRKAYFRDGYPVSEVFAIPFGPGARDAQLEAGKYHLYYRAFCR
ncbi:hypothetical protein [Haloplasma contractile]|uniref:hypothetical protein n=1 Tax=Haloplasma contractile TaxID=471825 RepID=UPI0002122C96|nr:hypothetical protein [Haloplasma contractile]